MSGEAGISTTPDMGYGGTRGLVPANMGQKPSKNIKRVDDDKAVQILREFRLIQTVRYNWESHWEEIAQRIWPTMSATFYANAMARPEGTKRNQNLFDSTGMIALGRFASVVDSLLTPQNSKWHRLIATNRDLQKLPVVRKWFEEATDVLFKLRNNPDSNFIGQNSTVWRMLGAFGTGTMFVDKLWREPGIRYKAVPLGELYFAEDHQGRINRVYRRFQMKAHQIRARFPNNRIPPEVLSESNYTAPYWIVHYVGPRADYDAKRLDAKGMEFESAYVSETQSVLLEESGYSSFPYPTSRFWNGPNEVYGRSPAMDVLPAIKTLNEEKKAMLKQAHRVLDPVLLLHDDGALDGFSLLPGAMNYGGMTADGKPLVGTLPTGNIQIGKEAMDDERATINDAFLVSLFQILTETPEMTATEVLERTKEKGMLLTPTVGRQQSEYLGPLIERELDLAARQGLLPPMPPVLREARGEYHVEYDSPLTRAQRAEEAAGLMRTVESMLQTVQITQDTSRLDVFDWDVVDREIAEIQGVPFRWMSSPEKIAAARAARAQQLQSQQDQQALPGVAAMVKAHAMAKKAGTGAA